MKSFSKVRDTWRGTQNYMEKRRGKKELEAARRSRGGIKRGESNLASNHFPYVLSAVWTPEMFTELHREGQREKGDRAGQEDKRGNQKEGNRSSQ